jgi:Cdc6-like AAA superfamily ATPase
MTNKTYKQTVEFLNQLEKSNNIVLNDLMSNYINEEDFEDFDQENAFDSLQELIQDGGGFDIEIIYYASAMDYLRENDPSLQESLGLASDMGFELKNLNSETLASLLKSQNEQENFFDLQNEIEEFFNN